MHLKKVYCSLKWFSAASLRFTAPLKVDCTNSKRFSSSFNNWEEISEKKRCYDLNHYNTIKFCLKKNHISWLHFSVVEIVTPFVENFIFSGFLHKDYCIFTRFTATSQRFTAPSQGLLQPHRFTATSPRFTATSQRFTAPPQGLVQAKRFVHTYKSTALFFF